MTDTKGKGNGLKFWVLLWGLGIAGQLCWNIENQWFNTFVYAKIAKDPSIVSWMVAISSIATTFSTFYFGTLADRMGRRKPFVVIGYLAWGVFTITFGLTQFISSENLLLAAILVVICDAIMSFFGSMGNDSGFNSWSNDHMTVSNRGQLGACLAIQPVIGTIVGTLVGGALIGTNENYMLLFCVMGGIVMAIGILAWIFMKEQPELRPFRQGTFWQQFASVFNFKKLFQHKELLWVNLYVTVYFIAFNIYFTYMGNYMIYYLGFTEWDMGLIQGIALILAMVLVLPSTLLINRKKSPLVAYMAVALTMLGLIVVCLFVSPETVDNSSAFASANLVFFVAVFLIGAGYMIITQTATIWSKQLFPSDTKGQFEGVRIVFFVMLPMVIAMLIASPVIKSSGEQFLNSDSNQMEYIPNNIIFVVGAIITVLSLVPITVASKYHARRIVSEQESNSSHDTM